MIIAGGLLLCPMTDDGGVSKTERIISEDSDPRYSWSCLCLVSCTACCSNCRACSFTVNLGSGSSSTSPSNPSIIFLPSLRSDFSSCSSHWTGSITILLLIRASLVSHLCSLEGKVQACPELVDGKRRMDFLRPLMSDEYMPRWYLWFGCSGLLRMPSSWYRGLVLVRGFSSERKVILLSDLGKLLSRTPLAVDSLWAVMAREANELMRRCRSPSFRTHLLVLLSA